ncbi:endo-1,4-beta-xylanase [Rufibacter roseolus]|uniref:endo-1,4-beta-xylanase n=1 Tax=Rufibacter roseolus TaxID=2817375 RepID=UPI001B306ED7|nr:endo-1,4-beta-xylanase [Rufibacter roseolus]
MLKIFTPRRACSLLLLLLILGTPLLSRAQLAKGKPKFLGNVIDRFVPGNFSSYWNQVTPANASKWGVVEGTRNVMNWADLDMVYNYAASKNIPFKAHTLVWGMQEPAWVSTLTPAEQATELEEWFQLFSQRYPNTQMIDVVNEPLHVTPSFINAIGGTGATGWDWVIWSFQKARQYFPNAKLILNDYSILGNTTNTTNYIKIINLLKARNLIDGIGVQGHGLEYAQSTKITSSLNSLQQTGVPIYVTELDLEHADDATQLGMYQRVFPLLYEHPGVTAVTLWGYLAGEIWKPNAYLLGKTSTIGTATLSTTFQDYTFSGSGKLQVHLTNDHLDNARDMEIDYIIVNGVTYQAEDMAVNTGVWTGKCGGSYSQLLHCDGYIEFPAGSGTITVRARGTTGFETMEVRTIDDVTERAALAWLKNTYFNANDGTVSEVLAEAEAGLLGGTNVASTRTGFSATGYVTGFDASGDYVEMNVNLAAAGSFPLVIRYAADVSVARSIKVNGTVVKKNLSFPASATFTNVQFNTSFLAGKNTIRIYVERGATGGGDIDYVKVSGAKPAGSTLRIAGVQNQSPKGLGIYPNPAQGGTFKVDLRSLASTENLSVQVVNVQGQVVYNQRLNQQEEAELHTNLRAGLYLVRLTQGQKIVSQQKLVIRN